MWGEAAQKSKPADPPPDATELREGAFVATILCDDREEEMEENMEQVRLLISLSSLMVFGKGNHNAWKMDVTGDEILNGFQTMASVK